MPKTPGAFLVLSWCTPGALLVHSWCTPGSLLVHFWCTPGALPCALLVHSWFTPGALVVHSWCTPGSLPVHSWFTLGALQRFPERELLRFRPPSETFWIAFSLTYKPKKGIAPLPKGSLDPPHRNVWIAFSQICKPERELHRFRKEVSIFRTKTFGSPFRQLANPKGNCTASERKARSSAQKRLDRPRNYHIHHRKRRNHDQAAAEYPSDAPNREVDERAWAHPAQRAAGICRCVSTATFILRTALWHLKQLHNRDHHHVYGNWEKHKEQPKSLDHGKASAP